MRRNILIGCGVLGSIVVVLFLVVFVLAVVRGGQTGSNGGSGSQSPPPPPSSPSSPKSQDSQNKEYAVGDTITLSDRTLRVNEAQPGYVSPNQFERPQDSGNQFVRVNVTITNTSDRQINFNPVDFKLQDTNGVQRDWHSVSQLPTPLSYGSLAPNGSVTGNMVFEAPQGDTGLKLIYKPNAFGSETVTVKL